MLGGYPQILQAILKLIRQIGGQVTGLPRLVHNIVQLTGQFL